MAKPHILIVDDETDIVETVRFGLEQEGFEVSTAGDGEQALERARRMQPDLIVMDVMMPKENGYRVARQLREDQAAGKLAKRPAILLLTARNLKADPEREQMFAEFSQADAIMYKPFEMDELVKRVRGLLAA